jgi:hypothetical protein
MYTVRYFQLSKVTGELSDAHSSCMSEWLRNRADRPEIAKKCYDLAVRYKKALAREIAYLESRPATAQVLRRMSFLLDYTEMVQRDLAVLSSRRS